MSTGYLHGYDAGEQRRLIEQAAYMRDTIITPGLEYRAGERVLDIGCGVGAVMGVMAGHAPGVRLSGIDLEPRQIEYARGYLTGLGLKDVDLRVGDAAKLPWADGSFDHVFMMWFIEHLKEPAPVLAEALRVLRPGGTITSIETDYATFKVWPHNEDWELLERAQFEHFRSHGDAHAGRNMAGRLAAAGFANVRERLLAFHYATGRDAALLRTHVEYVTGFLEPAVPGLARLGFDAPAMRRGVEYLRDLWKDPEGSMVNVVYRVTAERSS